MFGMKADNTYKEDVTDRMEQFAIVINPKRLSSSYEYHAQLLNEWCYENKCIPLNFKIEGQTICAIVRRVRD